MSARALGTAVLAAAIVAVAAVAAPAVAGTPPSGLQAKSALLVEESTGDVVFARGAHVRRPIASTTKLMTALLVTERVSLSDVLVAPAYHAAPAESTIGLRRGERMSVRDLLRALLLASANDAAETFAEDVSGSRAAFVAEMNARARELGLADTHFANPIGLDQAGNYSSAADLASLARVLLRDAFVRETVGLPRARLRSGRRPRTIVNRNMLVRRYEFVDGVKTGHTTQAGYVLVGAATRRGVTVLSVVLGEPSEAARDRDSLALLEYGLSRYSMKTLVRVGQAIGRVRVKDRFGDFAGVVAGAPLRRAVPRGATVHPLLHVPAELDGPLPAGYRVGYLELTAAGRVLGRVPVLTAGEVPGPNRWIDLAGKPGTLVAVGILGAALSLALVRRRRRAPGTRPERTSGPT